MSTPLPHQKLYQSFLWLLGLTLIVHVIVITADTTCPTETFSCNDGTCIHNTWKCDGEHDCASGVDEDPLHCVACPADQFVCNDGKCIQRTWRCDGDLDCLGGEDEDNCELMSCSTNTFACANGKCIAKTWRCDGDNDCADGSDEINCDQPGQPVCDAKSFRCDDGRCISVKWRCDGDNDCPDMSDEANCNPCESYGFLCLSGECTSKDFVCDGVSDCIDSSDELNCDSRTTAIRTTRKETLKTTQFISRTMASTATPRARTRKAPTQFTSSVLITELTTEISSTPSTEVLTDPVTEILLTRLTKLTPTPITPYRLEGRVAGIVNGKPLEEIKMSCHGTDQWKSYVTFHPVPQSLMTSLYPLLVEMTSLMGWMLAAKKEISGFAFTEGKCTRRAHISFETGDNVTILQKFQGKTGQSIAVHTFIEGTVPVTEQVNHERIVLDNVDRYTQLYPGMLYSSTTRQFQIGGDVIKYTSKQHVSFDALLATITMESKGELAMNISDVTITYDNITNITRLGLATHITMESAKQSFITIQPSYPGHSSNDLYIYIAIAGSMTAAFILVIVVTCVVKRRRSKTNHDIPDILPSSQAENRAYMEMGSAAIYEEIPSRAFDPDYVSSDDITCHRDQDVTFSNSRTMNEYSDMNYEVPKTNSYASYDHKHGLNNNTANLHTIENGNFRDSASTDKYYLSPCYMGTNGGATGNIEVDDYMKPVQSIEQ